MAGMGPIPILSTTVLSDLIQSPTLIFAHTIQHLTWLESHTFCTINSEARVFVSVLGKAAKFTGRGTRNGAVTVGSHIYLKRQHVGVDESFGEAQSISRERE